MTRPKGASCRIILDLSYGYNSVNKATDKYLFDEKTLTLKLPSSDALLPTLNKLGPDSRVFKFDIS